MRRTAGVLVGMTLLAPGAWAQEPIEAPSTITAVTVFPDRAGVTRTARVQLPNGSHAVTVGPLPSGVEPDSVSVRGAGEAAVTLYGARVVTRQLEAAQDPRVNALEDEIRELTRRSQTLQNTTWVLEQERQYLASIQAASSEQISKELVTKSPSASDAASLLAFLDEALLKTFARQQEADLELEETGRQLDKLQRELAQLAQGRFKQETAILVELEASRAGAFELQVSYRLPGATWQPSYEARASTSSDQVELGSSALVRQQTGEDWPEVALTLSTARPAIAGSMPELQPWKLRPWEPILEQRVFQSEAPMARAMSALEGKEALGKKARRDEAADAPASATPAQALIEAQGPAVTFTLPRRESIPADWQPHKVPIGSQRLTAALAYEATPKLSPYAYLRAKVTNTSEVLYLPGPVAVFLDDGFVATAHLKLVAPGETFDLYLGADERVKVERKQLKERVEVSLLPGLRGKTKSTDYEWLTTLENFTGRRITILVSDQIPVSEREEIVVESVAYRPEEVGKDPEKPGVFRWTVELGPTQKQELRVSYRIRHPVDLAVQ